jgi:hypothetical protein
MACLAMLCASFGTADAQERMRRQVAPVKKAPAPVQKMAPAMKPPPKLNIGPDLTLGACEVLCDRGGGYSKQVCQDFGYSDEFRYRVRVQMRNDGNDAASIEEGWRVWGATHQAGNSTPTVAGSAMQQASPTGGLYLAAGATVSGSSSPGVSNLNNLSAGTHRVVFTADPENHIAETDEANNTSQCQWTVEDMPPTPPFDLTVTHISVSPSSGPPATNFQFTVTVKNIGGATFNSVATECEPGATFLTPKLEENETAYRTYSIPGPMTPGTKTITCSVHSVNPGEQDTTNNSMSKTFTVTQP